MNTLSTQTLPENCRGWSALQLILWGRHHPNTEAKQRCNKERKLHANITEHTGNINAEIFLQLLVNIIQDIEKIIHHYLISMLASCHGCKDSSIFANQSINMTNHIKLKG